MKKTFGVLFLAIILVFSCLLGCSGVSKGETPETPEDATKPQTIALNYSVSSDGTYALVSGYGGELGTGGVFNAVIEEKYQGKYVTYIGSGALENCVVLSEVVLSDRVVGIGESAFYGCILLTEIDFANSVRTIGDSAFQRCESVQFITLPNSVRTIGEYAFSGCKELIKLTIDKDDSSLAEIKNSAFAFCETLGVFYMPNSVETVGSYAFSGCSNLAAVVIGSGTRSIGKGAFCGCDNLRYVFYAETEGNWENVSVNNEDGENAALYNATLCFYSEEEPELNEDETAYVGNFWCYKNGSPTLWAK